MSFGHNLCAQCKNNPSHELTPCGHTTCFKHYLAADPESTTCGTCGQGILTTQELQQKTPTVGTIHPADRTWYTPSLPSVQKLSGIQQVMSNQGGSASQGNDNGNGNGDSNSNEPYRGSNTYTAPPGLQYGANNIVGQPRYVPPMMRDNPPEIRPESSASNHTFASQVPNNYAVAGVNRGAMNFPTGGYPRPTVNYSYGLTQLTQPFVKTNLFDPFLDGPRAQPPPPVYPINGNGAMGPPVGNANNFGAIMAPSAGSSTHDSAVANSRGVDLANMIRTGRTDNPRDVDFGNPGPSRHAPAPILPAPQNHRGHVAAAAGAQSLTTTNQSRPSGMDNINGNAAAFLGVTIIPLPEWFSKLIRDIKPTVEQVFDALPFIEACRVARPSTAGVIRIINIPYMTSRSEIIAFLGRNVQICSQPPGSPYHAVHIMMDRHTSKTMDAFVELESAKEAQWVVTQFARRIHAGRQAKIGDRSVVVEMSSQQEFMSEMFPRAKNVRFEGAMPIVDTRAVFYYQSVQATGFNGFLQDEEIVHITKHAETPQRSPFAQRCTIRVYESLISTIHKYPWYAVNHVLLRERDMLFDATLSSVRALMILLRKTDNNKKHDPTMPTPTILNELAVAALTCPGFTERQKASIVLIMTQGGYGNMSNARGMNFRYGGNHKYSKDWPFHVLVKVPGVTDEMVEYVADLLQEASGRSRPSLADLHSQHVSGSEQDHFGDLDIQYGAATNLADAGRIELRSIETLLSRVLPRASRF